MRTRLRLTNLRMTKPRLMGATGPEAEAAETGERRAPGCDTAWSEREVRERPDMQNECACVSTTHQLVDDEAPARGASGPAHVAAETGGAPSPGHDTT